MLPRDFHLRARHLGSRPVSSSVALSSLRASYPLNAAFTLRLVAEPSADASSDFLDAAAEVSSRDFAGRTRFTIARRDIAAFAADVNALQRHDIDLAQLLGGWDAAEERLRLRLTRAGTTELYTVRARVADTVPGSGHWDRVETQFVCTARALSEFLGVVERIASAGTTVEATLPGDSDPVA
jgi:hypothetical protein